MSWPWTHAPRAHNKPRAASTCRLSVEPLENRLVPAAITPNPALTSQENYVQALYETDLGRKGSVAELDGWVTALNSPGGSPALVAGGIAHSQEGYDHLVTGWYVNYLGRRPQNGEEMSWVSQLQQGQVPFQVLSQILGSSEFFQDSAQIVGVPAASSQTFVQALYQLSLHRQGSPDEIAGWVNQLPAIGAAGVAAGILSSTEVRNEVVVDDYTTLLQRQPSDAEVQGLVTSGLTLADIRIAIQSSAEFMAEVE
jgi:hypothetical protein